MVQLKFASLLLILGVAHTSAQMPVLLTCTLPIPDDYTCGYEGTAYVNDQTYFLAAHLPGRIDSEVRTFFIRRTSVGAIPSTLFETFLNLQTLHIDGASAFIFNTGSTAPYMSLRNVIFSGSRQVVIPDNAFIRFPNVISLTIQESDVGMLGTEVFNGLVNLQDLIIIDNLSFSIGRSIFTELGRLINLRLSNADGTISIDQEFFRGLFSLQNLNLEGSNLRSIGANTFSILPNLLVLRLSNNPLTSILVSIYRKFRPQFVSLFIRYLLCLLLFYFIANYF